MNQAHPNPRGTSPADPRDRQSIQVLSRAAAILRSLQSEAQGLMLSEIARVVDLPRSTAQRIVDALSAEGMLVHSLSTNRIRLGPALIALGAASVFPIAELARPVLERIASETSESVVLTRMDSDKVIVVDQISASQRLASVMDIGAFLPVHCSASGKAMLSYLKNDELDGFRSRIKLNRLTPETITVWADLRKQVEDCRHTGIAFDREEHSIGVCSAAIALKLPNDELVAIAITAPTQRFTNNEESLIQVLRDHLRGLRQMLVIK